VPDSHDDSAGETSMTASGELFETEAASARTVLILDSDPELRRFLMKLLGPAGFGVVQVRGTRELLAALLSVRPALIVIDFALVEMSRVDLVAFLRCRDEWRRIPLLVVADETAMAFPIRVDAPVIYKPDRAGLLARVETVLRSR
jgi:DNA-binding response OmpR family regulator